MTTNSILDLTGPQKAAILVLQLDPSERNNVLAQFSSAELEAITTEIARIDKVDPVIAEDVFNEFYSRIGGPEMVFAGAGGLGTARSVLEGIFSPEEVDAILERVSTTLQGHPFDFLQHADARQIVSLLSGEHPQLIALVLAHLRQEHAAQIVVDLPEAIQAEVAHRMALMDRTSPEIVAHVAEHLASKASAMIGPQDYTAVGGVQPLVEIINRVDPASEKNILEGLEQRDPELAEEVRSRMFVFEDVINLEDRAMQLVLRSVENPTLAKALKGVPEIVKDKVMRNMSENARLALTEEIEVLGRVLLSQVEEARASIVAVIRKLEEDGQILIRRDSEDEYVS